MTTVETYHKDHAYSIKLKGHATGNQDACSGISTLVTALAGYLYNDDTISIQKVKLEDGNAEIVFFGYETAQAVYDMTVIGLKQIELIAPENILIK